MRAKAAAWSPGRWVRGHPTIVMPRAAAAVWPGLDGPLLWESADKLVRVMAVEGADALLFHDPEATAWFPGVLGPGVFVQAISAPSEAAIARGLAALPGQGFTVYSSIWTVPAGPLVMFDAHLPGRAPADPAALEDLGPVVPLAVPAGRYRLEVQFPVRPAEDVELVVVRPVRTRARR